jgi:hypothetical protein
MNRESGPEPSDDVDTCPKRPLKKWKKPELDILSVQDTAQSTYTGSDGQPNNTSAS